MGEGQEPGERAGDRDKAIVLSDDALVSMFAIHVQLLNAERTTIWQRYTAFLIANSLLMTLGTRLHTPTQSLMAAVAGALLCVFWCIITVSGYRLFEARLHVARQLRFSHAAHGETNPVELILLGRSGGRPEVDPALMKDHIRTLSIALIVMFMLAYAVSAILVSLA